MYAYVTGSETSLPATLRVRVDLSYEGSNYHGWARQPELPTVQGAIEDGLARIIRRPVRTVVAGRTDAGVHARQQVFHCDLTPEEWAGLTRGREDLEPKTTLVRRLNAVLRSHQGGILIRNVQVAPPGFDARFSALQRSYQYRIADSTDNQNPLTRGFTYWHTRALDASLMHAEAQSVLGLHDFLTYCKPRPEATTVRELKSFTVHRDQTGVITARLVADAFCHNMVRALVGAVLQVGDGSKEPGWLAKRLQEQTRDSQIKLAPAHGLLLESVSYPEDAQTLAQRAEATRARR